MSEGARKKIRSPSFPFISLMEAVARARRLYEAERWHPVRPEVAVAHWGYSPTSSGGHQTLAALRAYGLIQDDEGMVRLSDRALRLLRDPGDTPERTELLRQAALAPPLHSRLWERYGADLPSDKDLRSWLVLELRFNEGSVEDFLRSYKETMVFAGLSPAHLPRTGESYVYDVALSFAGEDRHVAQALAEALRKKGISVFYDQNAKATLWGKNLYSFLSDLYQYRARFCVIFLSKHYATKQWTNHELQAAQSRALQEKREYILPVRLDNTEISGILPTIGYLSWPPEDAESTTTVLLEKILKDRSSSNRI
jgi:hypothetical protein